MLKSHHKYVSFSVWLVNPKNRKLVGKSTIVRPYTPNSFNQSCTGHVYCPHSHVTVRDSWLNREACHIQVQANQTRVKLLPFSSKVGWRPGSRWSLEESEAGATSPIDQCSGGTRPCLSQGCQNLTPVLLMWLPLLLGNPAKPRHCLARL